MPERDNLKEKLMKKITLTAILALSAFASLAADYVSMDADYTKDNTNGKISIAQYVRAGKEINGIQYGLQSRTARYTDGTTGLVNNFEVTAGKNIGMFTPYVGIGYTNGLNGASNTQYTHGIVGAHVANKMGPGVALAGVRTRVNYETSVSTKDQTVVYATYMIPVVKNVALNVNYSKSYQDIQENAYGLGLSFGF